MLKEICYYGNIRPDPKGGGKVDINQMLNYLSAAGRIVLPVIAVILVLRCTISLIRNRPRNKPMGILVNAINGDKIFLDKWETSIGRSKSCDITLAYGTVSRFHAVISRRRNGWTVTDTGSHSGTFVNAQRINGKTYLNDGDAIMFGDAVLFFSAPDAAVPEKPKAAHGGRPAIVDPSGNVVYLDTDRPEYLLGRGEDCDIRITYPAVSRRHAVIRYDGHHFRIADCGSKSGTFVNGSPADDEIKLRSGDTITVGGSIDLTYYDHYQE